MSDYPRILNAEPEAYSEEARAILSSFATVDDHSGDRSGLLQSIGTYDGLIVRLGYRVDSELLDHSRRLRVVATPTTGLNHIDLAAAERMGVTILSLKGESVFLSSISATAEHTWALLLALVRRLPEAVRQVRAGDWDRDALRGGELSGKVLGVVGFGRLGKKVANYGLAFGMRVLASDVDDVSRVDGVRFVGLETLLREADVVSVHVPFAPETAKMIDAAALSHMKPSAVLVNTSRGEIIDEPALLEHLEQRRIAGACLDVLSGENAGNAGWRDEDPLLDYARRHENLIVTPHIGGATVESMGRTEVFIAEKLKRFFSASSRPPADRSGGGPTM